MLAEDLQEQLRRATVALTATDGPAPLRGEDIFESNPDYPRSWDEFIGQSRVKARMRAAIASAKQRGTRLDHTLIATGQSGAGKTALAKLVAFDMGVGLVEMAGKVTAEEARKTISGMQDGDSLIIDEVHQMGRRGSEWLLHLLQDGGFMTATGFQKMPDITVIAATTDAGVLPETVLNRFPVRPQFEAYTADEASQIAQQLAARTGITLDDDTAHRVARACRGSSRDMKALLIALRDAAFATEDGTFELALEWTGLTHDGLTRQMSDYLTTLVARCQGRAGLATIASIMGEPGPLHHTEKALMQLGYITIEPNGRKATAEGLKRVRELLGV